MLFRYEGLHYVTQILCNEVAVSLYDSAFLLPSFDLDEFQLDLMLFYRITMKILG